MELQQLRYFSALAQELHFGKASAKMHVSQPTLSQQLKKLEEELGAQLFERSSKRVKLTATGESFLPHAMHILDTLHLGIREIQERSGEIAGRIRIATIPTMGPYLLPPLLGYLRKNAPKLQLELFEETTSVLLHSLKEGRLDLGVLSSPINAAGIVAQVIGKEPFYLAVSDKHPLASRKSVRFKDIEKERMLILQEGHCFGDQMLEYCKRSRQDPQVIFQGSSLTSVTRLAASGEGVTIVPQMARHALEHRDLAFIPFSPPVPTRDIVAAWRVTAPLTHSHRFLIDALNKTISLNKN